MYTKLQLHALAGVCLPFALPGRFEERSTQVTYVTKPHQNQNATGTPETPLPRYTPDVHT